MLSGNFVLVDSESVDFCKDLIEQNRTLLALDNYHTEQTQKRKKPGFENPKPYTATLINNENEKHTQTYSTLKANKRRKVFNLTMAEKKSTDSESTKTKFPDNISKQTVNNSFCVCSVW
jgi:hypothetical protein